MINPRVLIPHVLVQNNIIKAGNYSENQEKKCAKKLELDIIRKIDWQGRPLWLRFCLVKMVLENKQRFQDPTPPPVVRGGKTMPVLSTALGSENFLEAYVRKNMVTYGTDRKRDTLGNFLYNTSYRVDPYRDK